MDCSVNKQPTLLQFPCTYPLKVLGRNGNAFHAAVTAIIEKHVAAPCQVTYSIRMSSQDTYMSITATFIAESATQLSAIYEELSRHELVLMTL